MPSVIQDSPLILVFHTTLPFLDSNITLTFNTETSCWLVWSEER
jgi:hypothetical protein